MSDPAHQQADERPVANRGFEIGVSAFLLAIALLVITDSLRVGIGWADDGPRSGYFPFYIGLMLAAASGWTLLRELLRKTSSATFATREQLGRVVAVLVPTLLYLAAIAVLGIYVASVLLIAWFMRRHGGGYRWHTIAAVSVGVPLVFFFVFERWFLVLLPKGPLERLIGL